MMAEQAQMAVEEARAEADRLRMEAEEAARMASGDAAAAEQRAADAEADAAAAREQLRLAQEALAMAEIALMMAEQRASGAEGELDALKMAVVARNQANVIDLVANNGRKDEDGNHIGAWAWRQYSSVSPEVMVNHTYRDGGNMGLAVWHDNNGNLQIAATVYRNQPLSTAPYAGSYRYINTALDAQAHEGLTTSRRLATNHGLGSDWQVTELKNVYENVGTFGINIATDLRHDDMATYPYGETYVQGEANVTLDGVPSFPVDQDAMSVLIFDNDTIRGSLDGVSGTFSCAHSDGCWFASDRASPKFYVETNGVFFTPDGGTDRQCLRPFWVPRFRPTG